MPPKSSTGKKVSTTRDELGMKGGGCYAITPFVNFDSKGRTLFKIGKADTIWKRIDNYNGYFPTLVTIVAVIDSPRQVVEKGKKALKLSSFYLAIERSIIEELNKLKNVEQVYSTGRVKQANTLKEGASEWFLCTTSDIHTAFTEAAYKHINANEVPRHLHNYKFNDSVLRDSIREYRRDKKNEFTASLKYFY